MPINWTWPNAQNNVTDTEAARRALVIEQFDGEVLGTRDRLSVLKPHVTFQNINGTDALTTRAIGASVIRAVERGVAPTATPSDLAKLTIILDKMVISREAIFQLDEFLTNINMRKEIASEQGKAFAKFVDNALLIQAVRAGMMTESTFSHGVAGKPTGHHGGTQFTLGSAAEREDPEILYQAIKAIVAGQQKKDVDPMADGTICVVSVDTYHRLMDAEKLINVDYITSVGNKVQGGFVIKALGIPVVMSNNLPQEIITDHALHTVNNTYNGDYSKVVAAVFAPKAIQAGESIGLKSEIWWDPDTKFTYIDSTQAITAGPRDASAAGVILIP